MNVQMSKVKTILFSIAIFVSTFTIMWQMYEVVIINDLYMAFPDNEGIITGLMSWPALITAGGSLLGGALLKKISTKMELTIAAVLMLTGIVPVFSGNVYALLTVSILMAFAAGLSNTAGMALLTEVFSDENRRNRMMGYYNASMSLISCGLTLVGGILAVNGWRVGFNVYWLAVPMLILTIIGLPDIKPVAPLAEAETQSDGKGFGAKFWVFYIILFIYFMMYCPFFTFISVYVGENAIGDTAFIGVASTLSTFGSMVAGFVFGYMFSKLKRITNVIFFVLPVIIYILLFTVHAPVMTCICAFLYGFSYGGVFTFCYAYPAYVVPMEKMGLAMGLMTLNYSLGIALGVYMTTFMMSFTNGFVTGTYPICAVICAVITVCELALAIMDKKTNTFG